MFFAWKILLEFSHPYNYSYNLFPKSITQPIKFTEETRQVHKDNIAIYINRVCQNDILILCEM